MQHYQARGMRDVTVEDIYIGNGVSELIVQAMQALLNSGDEMLVPAPDYPLWTAAVSLSGGNAVHYLCDESSDWFHFHQPGEFVMGRNAGINQD